MHKAHAERLEHRFERTGCPHITTGYCMTSHLQCSTNDASTSNTRNHCFAVEARSSRNNQTGVDLFLVSIYSAH